jgi:hypothetical protein
VIIEKTGGIQLAFSWIEQSKIHGHKKKGFDFKQKNNHGYLWPDFKVLPNF